MFSVLNTNPATHSRMCQSVDVGHVHGTVPCRARATVHCLRNGEDVCQRHESGHVVRTRCGQGEHEQIPVLVLGASPR